LRRNLRLMKTTLVYKGPTVTLPNTAISGTTCRTVSAAADADITATQLPRPSASAMHSKLGPLKMLAIHGEMTCWVATRD
jgi:hypothetical protein